MQIAPQSGSEQHLDKQWQWIWMRGEGKGRQPGKRWFPATVHLFLLSLHLTEEIKPGLQYALLSSLWLCCQMLQSLKTRTHTLGRRTQSQTDSNRVHYSTVQYCSRECEPRLQHWCITSGKSWQISLVKLNIQEPVGWHTDRGRRKHDSGHMSRARTQKTYLHKILNVLKIPTYSTDKEQSH